MRLLLLLLPALIFLPEQKVNKVNLDALQNAAAKRADDTLYVVNFWATWCKPCVAEMPYFEKAHTAFNGQKVKVIFVSLNSSKELSKVEKFVAEKNVGPQCLLLDAGNPNDWIDKIEKKWSGTIPATIMYKGGKKVFFREGEFVDGELEPIIQSKL